MFVLSNRFYKFRILYLTLYDCAIWVKQGFTYIFSIDSIHTKSSFWVRCRYKITHSLACFLSCLDLWQSRGDLRCPCRTLDSIVNRVEQILCKEFHQICLLSQDLTLVGPNILLRDITPSWISEICRLGNVNWCGQDYSIACQSSVMVNIPLTYVEFLSIVLRSLDQIPYIGLVDQPLQMDCLSEVRRPSPLHSR